MERVKIEKRTDDNSSADDQVGYGKPPKSHQFKPGHSGNPKGRPRGTKNFKTDLAEELAERVQVTENGRPRKMSKQRVIVKTLFAKATKGDTKATDLIIKLVGQVFGFDPLGNTDQPLAADDMALLADFFAHGGASSEDHKMEVNDDPESE